MSLSQEMLRVLTQGEKLTPKNYDFLLESLNQQPDFLTYLLQQRNQVSDILSYRSSRLAMMLHRIHAASANLLPPSLKRHQAPQLVNLLVELLPLPDLLDKKHLLELLLPALAICLEQKPTNFLKLASNFNCSLIKDLFIDEYAGKIMRQWTADASNAVFRDAATLETWTRSIIDLIKRCQPDHHGAQDLIQKFHHLTDLIKTLQDLLRDYETEGATRPRPVYQQAMVALKEDDKKAGRAKQARQEDHYPQLNVYLQSSLLNFGLAVPQSSRKLHYVIEQLKTVKTLDILAAAGRTFPCSRCKRDPEESSSESSIRDLAVTKNTPVASKLDLDILGQQLGTWKVLLSQVALKSLQTLGHSGAFDTVQAKLIDLTSGCAKTKRAGMKEQRDGLRVPLAQTECGKNISILWQIDVGVAESKDMIQQVVKIWEIGHRGEVSNAIDRVVILQKGYEDETVYRCRQRPRSNNTLLPIKFNILDASRDRYTTKDLMLDRRLVSQETIDMAHKFYALTRPVLHSLVSKDVSAQFPFDLSEEEAAIIRYFDTSSLILGRSGTGKTTCLVFKLVAKFLASKKTEGVQVKQILLTRSPHLAQKLQDYTMQLMKTLCMNTESASTVKDRNTIQPDTDENCSSESALTLHDSSYPLICTFDRLLQILENTIKAINRQNFDKDKDSLGCSTT